MEHGRQDMESIREQHILYQWIRRRMERQHVGCGWRRRHLRIVLSVVEHGRQDVEFIHEWRITSEGILCRMERQSVGCGRRW